MTGTRTRVLVEAGLTIALAYVLGRFMLFKLPFGGSVSLDMLPILIFALRRGLVPGLVTGAVYGLLNYTLDPVPILYPLQFVIDYAVAYGLVGLAGIGSSAWKRTFESNRHWLFSGMSISLAAGLLAVAARFGAHFVSGMVYFGEYAPAGQPVWLYSLLYNATYMIPSGVACLLCVALILPILQKAVPAR